MKTKIFYLVLSALLLGSCMKHDLESATQITDEQIKANVEKVFGETFDENHDWKLTSSGELTIVNIPSNIKTVKLVVYVNDEDGQTSMLSLNEMSTNGESSITMSYDLPDNNLGMYVMFISGTDFVVKKVEDNFVSYEVVATRAMTRAINYTLPTGELRLSTVEIPFETERGWVPGEKLYGMADYTSQKMAAVEYSDEYIATFRAIIFSYFKNGRKYNNLPLVRRSGFYNENVYPITTGKDPIIVSPVYKNDGGYKEIENSDLYYYYFKESDVTGDPVAYFESLPKYKAIQFNQCIKGDDVISKHAAYALIYWGEGTPDENTVGSYYFPVGYKIGFMVRAKTTAEGGKKQGELYGDGRLNNYINSYSKCNFKSSNLGENGPRAAWLTVNNRMFLCFESGTDADFNDIILEVEGGFEPIIVIPEIEEETYTFCFEDTELGDYDMNDVVIKAQRLPNNQVKYEVAACGAKDKLYIQNINGRLISPNTEVHAMFGIEDGFINTAGDSYPTKFEVINVASTFSFLDENTQPYIYDKDTNKTIKLSRIGQDPHGIMIPCDFKYPREKVCIKDAYKQFNNWGRNKVVDTDWYLYPEEGLVY